MSAAAPVAVSSPNPTKTWVLRVLCAIFGAALILAALETSLRLFDIGYPTSLTVPCTVQQQPAACYNLFFTAPFFPPGIVHTPTLFAVPSTKSQKTFRIFVLGESAAMGDPDAAYGFSRYLEVMLRNRYPQMNFEVINTGTVAINSHVGLPIAREIAKLKPDLVILYSGNNEVVGPYGAGSAFVTSATQLPVIRTSIWYHTTRTGQLLTKLGVQKQEWRGMEMFLDRQVPESSPLMSNVYSTFESNLRDTIAIARESGARVIVSTVATNLRDCAPFASMHRAGIPQPELDRFDSLVQEGTSLEQSHSFAQALKAYTDALAIDDAYAELEYRIGRVHLALGNSAEARPHFERARDLDTLRFRADSRINAINRAVARNSGADLVDTEQLFNSSSAEGVTGTDLIYEHVHMTPAGNYLLARAMFLKIASKLSAPVAEADVPSEAQCEEWLALTGYDRVRIAREMADRLQKAPFTNQLNHAEQMLRIAAMAQQGSESPQETATQYQHALQMAPYDRHLHYGFGRFLYHYNREAGADELRMSRPWDGFPVFAPDGSVL